MHTTVLIEGARPPEIFRPRPLASWIAISILAFYLAFCWGVCFWIYNPESAGYAVYHIEADSTTYFQFAGVLDPNTPDATQQEGGDPLVSFGGNLLGPVLLAKHLRTRGNVLVFNTALFVLMIWMVGGIPGASRRTFSMLYILSGQTMVAITTLNKEILACFGFVAFMRYYYSKRRPLWLLAVAILFSLGARWEQVAILLIFLVVRSRFFPLKRWPKTVLAMMVATMGVAYGLAMRYRAEKFGAFLAMASLGGTVARLDAIQARFGFPLVFLPKAMMNLFDRWLLAWYFITPAFWFQDFHYLQSQLIIHTQTFTMLVLFAALIWTKRFRLYRPIPFMITLYAIVIAVNPFIQPRYAYPIYVLLCLELARRADVLEPAPVKRPKSGALPAPPAWPQGSVPGTA